MPGHLNPFPWHSCHTPEGKQRAGTRNSCFNSEKQHNGNSQVGFLSGNTLQWQEEYKITAGQDSPELQSKGGGREKSRNSELNHRASSFNSRAAGSWPNKRSSRHLQEGENSTNISSADEMQRKGSKGRNSWWHKASFMFLSFQKPL